MCWSVSHQQREKEGRGILQDEGSARGSNAARKHHADSLANRLEIRSISERAENPWRVCIGSSLICNHRPEPGWTYGGSRASGSVRAGPQAQFTV